MAMSSASVFGLSSAELKNLSLLAENGDADAAFKVYQHYTFVDYDPVKSHEWVMLAANLGSVVAQYNAARYFLRNDNYEEARFWANKALINGDATASDLLVEIDAKERSGN